jgi:hypothetical protein
MNECPQCNMKSAWPICPHCSPLAVGVLLVMGVIGVVASHSSPNQTIQQVATRIETASITTDSQWEARDNIRSFEGVYVTTALPQAKPQCKALDCVRLNVSELSIGGFGSVMTLDKFAISNTGKRTVKNFRIVCDLYGPSRTLIGKAASTLYESVQPGQTRAFRAFNMGIINRQSASTNCSIVAVDIYRTA